MTEEDLPGADRFLADTHHAPERIKSGVLETSLYVINTNLAHAMRAGKMTIDADIMRRWRRDCARVDMEDAGIDWMGMIQQ